MNIGSENINFKINQLKLLLTEDDKVKLSIQRQNENETSVFFGHLLIVLESAIERAQNEQKFSLQFHLLSVNA